MVAGLKERNVLLGVSGGIAAYKAVELLRLMVREGASVWTVMSKAATEFVRPLSFQALCGHPVRTDMFSSSQEGQIQHIALADLAHVMVVAPATANIIAKMAHGLADDMLSTTVLAVRCPLVVCPAMNVNMYSHPATQSNIRVLRQRGAWIVEPEEGELACGWEGKGRLADLEAILETVKAALSPQDLAGERVLVTAGPTWEPLDPVRFLSNRSSGKMGFALARVAKRRGADVTLVSGPTGLRPPPGVRFLPVESAAQMRDVVMENLGDATVVVKAAAVADYRPAEVKPDKIKKHRETWSLALTRTPDILAQLGAQKGDRILVGFAAETRSLLQNAREKLGKKNLDWIVANDLTRPGAGFGTDTNEVTLLGRDGTVEELPQMSKEEVAWAILDRVVMTREARRREGPREIQ
jgi:phosphopantothenoylcysteine decarboxylase/phosphopantothenate--cysteine ligase